MSQASVIEKNTRFSESALWDLQRKFFEQQGINAWHKQVPFYITSNPYIANCYAQVCINFALDLLRKQQYNPDTPIYILELGTGSGKFSYYCMKRIFELQEELQLDQVKLVYVMTDFTESNLSFWQSHPQFQDYIRQGKLDFAIFDMMTVNEIQLVNQQVTLTADTVTNPMITFANYIFDTIPHDVFHVGEGNLREACTRLVVEQSNATVETVDIDDIDVRFDQRPVSSQVYQDPRLDNILQDYKSSLNNSTFLFPIAAFRSLQHLFKISNDKLLVIATDKGYSFLEEIQGRGMPRVITHGSFSMMVNFHAIGEFFKNCGGDVRHQSIRETIKTSVFIAGQQFTDLPATHYAVQTFIDDFGPGDFFNFHKHMGNTKNECELKTIISHMNFCRWDPRILNLFIDRIIQEISSANPHLITALEEGIPKVVDGIYDMPGVHENYFNVALLAHSLKNYDQALTFYQKVIEHGGKDFNVLYNMALCYSSQEKFADALNYFQQAQALNPDSTETAEWMEWIEKKQRDK
jgi:hypothetical protein